jgi:hypothetical protein
MIGAVLYLGNYRDPELGLCFQVNVEAPRKWRRHLDGLFKLIEKHLRENSIYKGHAIDGGENFIDVSKVDPADVVYTESVLRRLEGDVWAFIRHAELLEKLGQDGKFAVLFEGPYGCLAGDTEVIVNRGGNSHRRTMKYVTECFNGTHARYSWDPNIPTMLQYRSEDGFLRSTRLTWAGYSGVQPVYTVVTSTGRSLRSTYKHPYLTPTGWKRTDELEIGDEVFVRGEQRKGGRAPKLAYRKLSVGFHHPYSHGSPEKGRHVDEHRLVYEAYENGLSLADYLARLKAGEVEGLKFIDPTAWHVHHVNHDTTDNRLENLEKLSQRDHHVLHAAETTANVLYSTAVERIVSVELSGEEPTYDFQVEAPEHNFTANGFVVSNTGKSLAALLTAQIAVQHGWTFLMCRPGKDDLTTTLEMARMYQPAVVFAEDVDTMAGPQSGSTIERHLDMLDGIKVKGMKLLTVFTTNHAEDIHKAMLRPGRIGAVIHVGAMDRPGVEQLARRVIGDALDPDTDFDEVFRRTEGYMPAFVRECFDRSVRYAITLNEGELGEIGTEAICLAADGLRDQYRLMEDAKEDKADASLTGALGTVIRKAVHGVSVVDGDGDWHYELAVDSNGG